VKEQAVEIIIKITSIAIHSRCLDASAMRVLRFHKIFPPYHTAVAQFAKPAKEGWVIEKVSRYIPPFDITLSPLCFFT